MTTPPFQARRATVEDLPQLKLLWEQDQLPVEELEKRFKEFQVIAYDTGELLAAVGLEIAGLEGRLHSEVFAAFDQADSFRDLLWQRVQIIARNHGLMRVWTQLEAPFWHQRVFGGATVEQLVKLPAQFGGDNRPWWCMQLKPEGEAELSVEQQLALLKAAERERTDQLFRQARVLKTMALVVAIGVFLLAVLWAVYFFKVQRQMPPR